MTCFDEDVADEQPNFECPLCGAEVRLFMPQMLWQCTGDDCVFECYSLESGDARDE